MGMISEYWASATPGAKLYLIFSIGYFIFGVLFLAVTIWLALEIRSMNYHLQTGTACQKKQSHETL